MTKLKLAIRFYRNFYMSGLILSGLFIYPAVIRNLPVSLSLTGKLLTLPVILYLADVYHRAEYPYYKNLGLSRIFLLSASGTMDMILFIFILVLCFQIIP